MALHPPTILIGLKCDRSNQASPGVATQTPTAHKLTMFETPPLNLSMISLKHTTPTQVLHWTSSPALDMLVGPGRPKHLLPGDRRARGEPTRSNYHCSVWRPTRSTNTNTCELSSPRPTPNEARFSPHRVTEAVEEDMAGAGRTICLWSNMIQHCHQFIPKNLQ